MSTTESKWRVTCPAGPDRFFDYRDEAREWAENGHACVSIDEHSITLEASDVARSAAEDFPRAEAHRCRIDTTTADPFYPGNPGYVVVCDDCGPVGVAQDEPRDAQAIANRHEEVGGFERRS